MSDFSEVHLRNACMVVVVGILDISIECGEQK